MSNRISSKILANRSISISLDERLLAQLDAQGANRSALVSEALQMWLTRRRLEVLNQAYADLARLEAGDLAAAGDDAVSMGQEALDGHGDG
jgi:Arc/MetJ-type ribon-helix-helix transcriptional regulator